MNHTDAGDHVLNIALSTTESAIRIVGDGAANLAVVLTAILKNEQTKDEKRKVHPGKVRLREFMKNNVESSVFRMRYFDIPTFRKRAEAFGFQFYVVKDKEQEKPAKTKAAGIKRECRQQINQLDKDDAGYDEKVQQLTEAAKQRIRGIADFDVDVLVPAMNAQQTVRILQDMGYADVKEDGAVVKVEGKKPQRQKASPTRSEPSYGLTKGTDSQNRPSLKKSIREYQAEKAGPVKDVSRAVSKAKSFKSHQRNR